MEPSPSDTVRAAWESVTRLVEACRKNGRLYTSHPRAASRVSRTGQWLLLDIADLKQALKHPRVEASKRGRGGADPSFPIAL